MGSVDDGYLTAEAAAALDQELIALVPVEVLIEQAGLCCAQAICEAFPEVRRAVVYAGPGNNGADALVCAKFLKEFGFEAVKVHFVSAKPPSERIAPMLALLQDHYKVECSFDGADSANGRQSTTDAERQKNNVVVDGMLGFGSRGPLREPFAAAVRLINRDCGSKLCSIDCPTGWDVDAGPDAATGEKVRTPDLVVSLTAPKPCMRYLPVNVRHCIGGRFVPPSIKEKFGIQNLKYDGTSLLRWLS